MPAIFINPNAKEHSALLLDLNEQNFDLRLFVSDKLPKEEIETFPGKKAIGDILDDTHISTASEGAFCAIYFEGDQTSLRECFYSSIKDSSAQRFIWISTKDIDDNLRSIESLIYIKYDTGADYKNVVLEIEESEVISEKYFELKL